MAVAVDGRFVVDAICVVVDSSDPGVGGLSAKLSEFARLCDHLETARQLTCQNFPDTLEQRTKLPVMMC